MKKIKIIGEIGWDVYAREVDRQLSFAKGDDVEILLGSPGGRVDEAFRMFNSIKNYAGKVTFILTGYVASSASYVALARGWKAVAVEKNAVWMMHNPMACACGDYRSLGKRAKDLDDLSLHVAKTYSETSGIELDETRTMLDEETYIYGEDIVTQGFAGSVVDSGNGEGPEKKEAIALAKVAVSSCMTKVKEYEMSATDVEELSAMVMKMTKVKQKPAEPSEPVIEQEAIMDLKELQEKFPGLVAEIMKAGQKEGITMERARAKSIMAFRGKFPKLHAVVDTAVMEGHSMTEFNLNIMSAQTATDEVDAGADEVDAGATGGGAAGEEVEMADGVMTTTEHLDETSAQLAKLAGLSPGGTD